jgi:hypothetical protein
MVAAVGFIYPARLLVLAAVRQPDASRLLWLAPRGLITVLLFLTAAQVPGLEAFPFGAIMLVVLVTAAATALAHRGMAGAADTTAAMAPQAPCAAAVTQKE